MIIVRRRLACCTRERELSLDFDEQERIMTYDGLESCINQSYENESGTSRGDGCMSDSLDDDNSSCSSSKDVCGSFSSKWIGVKRADEHSADEWELSESPRRFFVKEKPVFATCFSDVETMKETFSKLLLGEDITGGSKGLASSLALSNAITHLAASVFGELWKLEPLPEERKARWRKEMDWLLSPTNYMVELVPAKQNGINGRMLEIMTPKARADIHINLPALQKLDSMLIGMLDSMVDTEFWYSEVGSRAEGRSKSAKESKRWWLPLPQVPTAGLSDLERKKLLRKSKMVYQVYKAAKSINESVLLEMPVPTIIKDALPKSGRANLGEELYKVLTTSTSTAEGMLSSLQLDSENKALEIVNKLEAAIFAWKEKISSQASTKSPTRTSWSFVKDPISEHDKIELLLARAEVLLQLVKSRYPNLPQTFLDATKIQYGKDVGHSILEAYSRVLGNLAFSILRRVGDILQEDSLSNPNSPVATDKHDMFMLAGSPIHSQHIRRLSLIDQMNKADSDATTSASSDLEFSSSEPRASSANASTPSRSRVWCVGGEACLGVSPGNSP